MSVRCDGCGLEYAGARGARGLLTGRHALRPRYLRMLGEVLRFHRRARAFLAGPESDQTLDSFLDEGRFSPYFRSHFMVGSALVFEEGRMGVDQILAVRPVSPGS